MVAENLKNIRNRIEQTCLRCGRDPGETRLVAVTKAFGVERIQEAVAAGQVDFGENYVQELGEKRMRLNNPNVRWHFIGHLQSNKVKHILEYIHLIHSVDNIRVAEEIQKRAERIGRKIDILIEVHTTDEATKFGVHPDQTVELVKQISELNRVNLRGLMTMGPFSDDPNDARPSFRQLVDLQKRVEKEGIENVTMRELSMGMSHDFEVALEEGATILRIGTAIFGKRTKPN